MGPELDVRAHIDAPWVQNTTNNAHEDANLLQPFWIPTALYLVQHSALLKNNTEKGMMSWYLVCSGTYNVDNDDNDDNDTM